MDYVHPEFLISAADLAAGLDDADLRVFDTAVFLKPAGNGYTVESGRQRYLESHIPGAGFIDLEKDWAQSHPQLRFTLPPLPDLTAAIGASGIGSGHRVVLYSSGHLMWATRAWWLLRYAGATHVAVLNGNLKAWVDAGYPLESGDHPYPAVKFQASPRTDVFADTAQVEAGMHGRVCTVNALSQALYEGSGSFHYGRPGHIPGSVPLPYDTILDNEFFLPPANLAERLEQQGMLSAEQVVTYCGGGIAATLDAFACMLMGQSSVAVYDGSMSEWLLDDQRPLTTGSAP